MVGLFLLLAWQNQRDQPTRMYQLRQWAWALSFVFVFCIHVTSVWPVSSRRNLLLFFFSFSSSFPSSLAAPPAWIHIPCSSTNGSSMTVMSGTSVKVHPLRSKVIICYFSAGCHGTVQSDLLCPSVLKKARPLSGRPPLAFSQGLLDSLLAGLLLFFLILDVALLHLDQWPPRMPLTVSLASHLFYSLARPRHLLEKNIWEDSECCSLLFFLPVPCALEALTVINSFVLIGHSHVWEYKWDRNPRCHQKTQETRQQNTEQPQPKTQNPKGHLVKVAKKQESLLHVMFAKQLTTDKFQKFLKANLTFKAICKSLQTQTTREVETTTSFIMWKPRTKDADLFHSSSWAKDEVELPHQVVQR